MSYFITIFIFLNVGYLIIGMKLGFSTYHRRKQILSMTTDWFSDKFSKSEIQDMWKYSGAPRKAFGERGQGRALMTIGSKGAGPSTLNSLSELLKQHKTVRVKVASDTIDTKTLSEEIMANPQFVEKAQLLAVKNREFMVGRKEE